MRFYLSTVALLIAVGSLTYYALGPISPHAFDAAAVDCLVREAQRSWCVPGTAVAIVRDDQVIYLRGFGVRDLDRNDPITPHTCFPIASCTKAFTTTALAMLVDEGKISWDDPVRQHLTYFHLSDPWADNRVTIRDLVTHRSGVAPNDFLWYRAPWGPEEAVRRLAHVKLRQRFRTTFQYQSSMFTAAGLAVAATAGMPWEEFVRQRIFVPLDMADASFCTESLRTAVDHASPHQSTEQGEVKRIEWYPLTAADPAGSITASASDLARWLRFQLGSGTFEGKRLVSSANLAETHTPQIVIPLIGSARAMNPDTVQMHYGMGWVIQDYRGQRLLSHAGLIDGFRAHLTLVPEARLGIVLLNNLDRTTMNLALSNTLVDHLLSLPPRDWNGYFHEQVDKEAEEERSRVRELEDGRRNGTAPSRPWEDYTGRYDDAAYGQVHVLLEGGRLLWQWNSFSGQLEPFEGDTFLLRIDRLKHPRVVFTLNAEGIVTAMYVAEPLDVTFRHAPR